jgi:eukaryotic-like serine/threonine-protein kinase
MQINWTRFNGSTLGGILIHFSLAVLLILTIAVLYFYAYLPSMTNHGETITVPNIEGKSLSEVETFLAQHDLRFEVSDSSYSSELPPLAVIKQYPHPGSKVKEDRKIYLTLNRNTPPTVPLPNLVEVSLINADALLKSNELKRGKIHLVPGPFLQLVKEMKYKGVVIAANTPVPKGAVIDLVVMDGGSKVVQFPSILDYSVEDAKVMIFGLNLNLGRVVLVGDTTGLGPVVIKQRPESGEDVMVGDVVDIWVGKPGTEPPDDDLEIDDN